MELDELKGRLLAEANRTAQAAMNAAVEAAEDIALYKALECIDWDSRPWANWATLDDLGLMYHTAMPDHAEFTSGGFVWKTGDNRTLTERLTYIKRPNGSQWLARTLIFSRPAEKQEMFVWPFVQTQPVSENTNRDDFMAWAHEALDEFMAEYDGKPLGQIHTYQFGEGDGAMWGFVASTLVPAASFRRLSGLPEDAKVWGAGVIVTNLGQK